MDKNETRLIVDEIFHRIKDYNSFVTELAKEFSIKNEGAYGMWEDNQKQNVLICQPFTIYRDGVSLYLRVIYRQDGTIKTIEV